MKKIFSILILCLIIKSNISFSQVTVFGQSHAFSGTGSGSPYDLGTNIFTFDTFVGPGGFRTIFRKNNYWYVVVTGIGISISGNTYYTARTVNQHSTISPPDCAEWQGYVTGVPIGYQWPGFPTTAPADPNGSIFILPFTGPSVSILPSSASTLFPDFIDLSNKSSSFISTIPNQSGRVLYNTCEEAIQFNNGTSWKSVWPHFSDYYLNPNQGFIFGDSNTQIYSDNSSATNQLVFKTGGTTKLTIGKAGFSNTSSFNFKSSIATPVATISTDYILTDDDYIIIHTGTLPHIITLPGASGVLGRQYIISNPSTGSLTFASTTIVGLGSTLLAGQNVTIVSNGGNWFKIN
jgi:hypothetical protein